MKNIKLMTIFSVIMIIFGIFGILAAVILWYYGEEMRKWLGAIVVSILLILSGILNISIKLKNRN